MEEATGVFGRDWVSILSCGDGWGADIGEVDTDFQAFGGISRSRLQGASAIAEGVQPSVKCA